MWVGLFGGPEGEVAGGDYPGGRGAVYRDDLNGAAAGAIGIRVSGGVDEGPAVRGPEVVGIGILIEEGKHYEELLGGGDEVGELLFGLARPIVDVPRNGSSWGGRCPRRRPSSRQGTRRRQRSRGW